MSYFEDYIEDGLCCESCGAFIDGSEAGFVRRCAGCAPGNETPAKPRGKNSQRAWGKKARKKAFNAALSSQVKL